MNDPQPSSYSYRSEPGGGPTDPTVRRFVLLSTLALMVAIVVLFGRAEVSRWHQANAQNAFIDQRYEDAVQAANKALEWSPGNEGMLILRAQARLQNNEFEASVADLDELIAAAAKDDGKTRGQDERDIQLLSQKAQVLQRLGRHAEVLSIWNDIVDFRQEEFRKRDDDESRDAYALALNNRAYMTAQAYTATDDRELFDVAEALEQSRKSIELQKVDDDPVTMDTFGYLLLLNDQAEEAVTHLERAVELTQVEQNAQRKRLQGANDQRRVQDIFTNLDHQFAVILHHRGEAYAAVGEAEKSKADIEEALRLGYNPAEGIW